MISNAHNVITASTETKQNSPGALIKEEFVSEQRRITHKLLHESHDEEDESQQRNVGDTGDANAFHFLRWVHH